MKKLNGKKGFTLIELLAVIVVLAIVMVIAVSTVLPYMSQAQKEAFFTEVTSAVEAGRQAETLAELGQLDTEKASFGTADHDGNNSTPAVKCISLYDLAKAGIWSKELSKVCQANDSTGCEYKGFVYTTDDGNTWYAMMENKSYVTTITSGEGNSTTTTVTGINTSSDKETSLSKPTDSLTVSVDCVKAD